MAAILARIFLPGVCVLLAGCGGPAIVSVSGKVSYEGQSIQQGQILFADANATGSTAVAPIENGTYTANVSPGEKIVRITASQETGRTIEGAMGVSIPEQVDLIPAEYNSASTLQRTISAEQSQVLNFELK